jgi:hypothetical protein
MDNLPAHLVIGIREAIEEKGATVIYLSPYSPDFSQARKLLVKGQRISPRQGSKNLCTGGIFLDELFIQKMPFRPGNHGCSRGGHYARYYRLVYTLLLLCFTQLRTAVNPHDIVYADEAGMDNRIGLWLWMELAVVKAFTH